MQQFVRWQWILYLLAIACSESGAGGEFIDVDSDGIHDAEDDMIDLDSDGINDEDDDMVDRDSDGINDEDDDMVDNDGDGNDDREKTSSHEICAQADIAFGMKTPTVVLLIDQSGTMEDPFGGMNRWQAVEQTLFDPAEGVVPALENEVRFGLTLYTSTDEIAEDGNCPVLTVEPPAMNNYDNMYRRFQDNRPIEDTPTGASINRVVDMMLADQEAEQNIIVLATDGLPDSCEYPDPDHGSAEADITEGESVAAAQNAYSNGIPLFVISVGDDVGANHLQDMANAGQGYDIGTSDGADFYMGLDPQSLRNAFEDIITNVRNCQLTLQGEVDEGEANQCTVTVDGQSVPFEKSNGWQLNNPKEIEILGDTCNGILDGTISNLSVDCPCGVYSPVV